MSSKYEYIVNAANDFITLIDRDYIYRVVNDSYANAIERPKEEILNKTVAEVWGNEKFEQTLKNYLDRCLAGEEVHYIEKFRFGIYQRYMHVSYYPYCEHDEDTVTHICVISHDITKLGQMEMKLQNYEFRDPVTGLYNRKSLEMILEMELEQARRSEHEKLRGLLYIGIENLTSINRKHGHTIGNILLENAGIKIKELLRSSDYIFRYEGNELVVILTTLARATDAAKVAEKIHNALTTPYNYKSFAISLECYLGIALYPQDGNTTEELVHSAITALGEAKHQHKPFLLYDDTIHEKAIQKLTMERDLHNAFHQGQFYLCYQPIVASDSSIVGAEALIRWEHPELGLVTPVQFLPLAVEIGLIREIGKWALFTATKQLRQWLDLHDIYISINLSAPEFENELLGEIVGAALRQAGDLDPRHIKFEITETDEMLSPQKSINKMVELNRIGVDIYIDDFGSGLSSLQYLKQLPAQTLKIDRGFIKNIEEEQSEREFLKTIIDMAENRGKQVIVEGVSSEKQYTLLREMGCPYMQGYYFSKPMPADEFTDLLSRARSLPR